MANATCSQAEIPADLPISRSITYAVVSSLTAPDKWMKACCDPSPVRIEQTCYEWCELTGNAAGPNALGDFSDCLQMHGRNASQPNILVVHHATSGAVTTQSIGTSLALVTVLLTAINVI